MNKKTVLITGSTSGIGLAGAEALARKGWQVLVHARSASRLGPVIEALKAKVPQGDFEGVTGDLSSLASVAELAGQVVQISEALAGHILPSLACTASRCRCTWRVDYGELRERSQ